MTAPSDLDDLAPPLDDDRELFDPIHHRSLGNGGYIRKPLPAHE